MYAAAAVAGPGGVERCQASPRAVGLTDRDGQIETGSRAVGEAHQFDVPLDDLHPAGLLGRPASACSAALCVQP
jgi:hypothetical protein